MKSILLLLLASLAASQVFSQTAQLNAYGEVQTAITDVYSINAWPGKMLEKYKDTLVRRLGEGMYHEVYNHAGMDTWPSRISTAREFFANETRMTGYNVWLMTYIDEYAVLRVPYAENKHMPSGFLPADQTDFYIVVSYRGVKDLDLCIRSAKNNAQKYPESLYARNYAKAAPQPGQEELARGIAAYKASEYPEALQWFTQSAEKGNADAMYNAGLIYYYDHDGGYSTSDILAKSRDYNGYMKNKYAKAIEWFKKGANAGSVESMQILGEMYRDGKGVDPNPQEAEKWFKQAKN